MRVKKTSDDDARIFAWLGKVRMPDGSTFGDRAVAAVTLDDCDHVMTALPKTAETPASRRHYAQALRKLLVYAVYPLRLLPDAPDPEGLAPEGWRATRRRRGSTRARTRRSCSAPRFRSCGACSSACSFARACASAKRSSSTWPDLDLERGVIRLDTNKTDDPRSWVLGEDVTRALEAWRKLRGKKAKKSPHVFPPALLGHAADTRPAAPRGARRSPA